MQKSGESLEAFHAALTAQAARSELKTLEIEIVRDLFILKLTMQDTLTFETLDPEEVLKRAIKIEHSKLTTMAFQKTNAAATVGTSNNYNSGVRIKQEPVMAVRNSTGNTKNQQYKREANNNRNSNGKTKPCNRCGRSFDQGYLKSCSALGKSCMNCGKPNHFAKMCRSQQVSEVTEESERSEEECDLIRENFGSSSDFEVMSTQTISRRTIESRNTWAIEITKTTRREMGRRCKFNKIDLLRDPTSNRVKSLRAMVRIYNQIIQLTVDTGSPASS